MTTSSKSELRCRAYTLQTLRKRLAMNRLALEAKNKTIANLLSYIMRTQKPLTREATEELLDICKLKNTSQAQDLLNIILAADSHLSKEDSQTTSRSISSSIKDPTI